MAVLGMDLGGTKLATAVFTEDGRMIKKETVSLDRRKGSDVGRLITGKIREILDIPAGENYKIDSIGISVPGISRSDTGTVWAPNIPGWDDYPLLAEAGSAGGNIPVIIDSDRACYIAGEVWKGNAKGCRDAVFLSVGTGIGAGIMVNGEILRGSHDIAGSIGWMALDRPYTDDYKDCGCFEYHASGEGIARVARKMLTDDNDYSGILRNKAPAEISSRDIFDAFEKEDPLASLIIGNCIEFWGMAVANLISLFNPEAIILGGGVFGPALRFIEDIRRESSRWAQPISSRQVRISGSALGGDAGVSGAGYMAMKNYRKLYGGYE
ncbi:MAG TPA: ROK family protein [Bacteroidales bacterium]|mgnify:CR=1 FL=1|jgi:glucokinase|nr:ROK family protein [Bacteroidales bacterium]HQH24011.1 ROK family protein [Bacteroidales bacterium]HQJ82234.1 ROK family protein [Bacteroidales bacterium]